MLKCSKSVMVTLFSSKLSLHTYLPSGFESSTTKKVCMAALSSKEAQTETFQIERPVCPSLPGAFLVLTLKIPQSSVNHLVGHLTSGFLLSPSLALSLIQSEYKEAEEKGLSPSGRPVP